MDILYNSATFCKASYNHARNFLCYGVTRSGIRGVPPYVQQTEVKNGQQQISVQGTVKTPVPGGGDDCPNLLASSMYNTKSVYYTNMVTVELK